MRKGQKEISLNKTLFLLSFFTFSFFIYIFNLHLILFQIFISKPLTLILIPNWLISFLILFNKKIGNTEIRKETKEKILFYSIFITFLIFYSLFFSSNIPIILAQTPSTTTTLPSYPSVTFYWKNVKTSSADVYIKTEAGSATYSGKIVFEIRKNVAGGTDLCCYLDGSCYADASLSGKCPSKYKYTAQNPVGSGTKEYQTTFTAKQEGDYHFDVWYYEGDVEKKDYGHTDNVHLVPCESTSYTSCGSAYSFGSSSGSKGNMCGSEQYYYVSAPAGKKCKITWTLSPSDSNYDLYVKWSSACPSTSSYDCSSTNSGSSSDSCSANGVLSSYALVKKVSGTGSYSISASVENCVNADCKSCGNPTSNDWLWSCWIKMKDENCNDLSWYDFAGLLGGTSPKCAVGASQAQHYIYVGLDSWWCPSTEAMWKEIKCGGGWPSGKDGDWCKVWWLDLTGWKWRQGVWDPDDGYCIITSGDEPNNGCTSDRRESTTQGIADTCPGRKAGDGKCEQACGADESCDEKDTADYCGNNGRCTSYCLCCEASDSDGIDYLKKGTTSGPVISDGKVSCDTKQDSCIDGKTLREYYINYLRYLVYQDYDCSRRTDGNIRCIDGKCGCLYDSDCPAKNNVKGKCDSPDGTDNPDTPGYTYTCYWKPCKSDDECVSGTYCYCGACSSSYTSVGCSSGCCNRGYGGTGIGQCVSSGTIYNNQTASYLCVS
jgi:hypothetical protein